jgi:peroxiredoxin Q/BCP
VGDIHSDGWCGSVPRQILFELGESTMTKELKVGDRVPELSLPDQHGKNVTLKSFKGKQLVLYFYPKDDTPGCTKESCDFRDVESQIVRAGGVIVGVSLDGKESHQKFIKKFGLPFPLLTDEDASISKAYGVYKEKSMYGKKYWGIERSTFVIDPDGRLKAVFRKVKVDGHVDEVLTALRA